jgi:Domain of Unknown Function (DUF1206)
MSERDTKEEAEQDARHVEDNPIVQTVARVGFVAAGLVQGLIGVIAIGLGLHRSGSTPDQTGALKAVAQTPGGPLVLWGAAVCALALGLWLVVSGFLVQRDDRKARWSKRLRHWGRAVVYLVIGIEALRVVLGGSASASRTSRTGSADVLSLPGGPVVLALVGAGVVVAGGAFIWIGVAKRFLRLATVPAGAFGRVFVVLGVVGYVARGVAIGIVGVLFIVAAITLDPKKAAGLDGALKALTALPFGEALLIVVGAGWIVAGVFSLLWAKQIRLDA